MVPPILLAPRPNHLVLDMCAAPGSKTLQLLDLMHSSDCWPPGGDAAPQLATGLLVAADVSGEKVTRVMAGRLRKFHSPCLALAVGNTKNFPFCRQPASSALATDCAVTEDGGDEETTQGSNMAVLFDRIMCDVPCSGDGTIRKEPSIWQTWNPSSALQLHKVRTAALVCPSFAVPSTPLV